MDIEINEMIIPQEPVTVKRIQIKCCDIEFNKSAKFIVFYFKSKNEIEMDLFKSEMITIEGEEYLNWNNDDNYIIDLICQKLNIEKIIPDI